ncbi:HEAT repeat-containing protein 2, partial [Tetrabaena socialis]
NLTEPCEEVRLALARLLRALVCLGAKSFGGYAGEAVALVGALCEDPFHEVQEEACAVVLALNDALGPRLHPIAKQLVASLLPLTTAKRHRVRVAALQALRPTMHQGAHEMILEMVAWRDPNVIAVKAFYGDDLKVNFCGKLASDPHPMVRREFLAVLADWLTALRERMDHEARLLPYVLSGLNDEVPEIQADAVALLERLGVQYEADHEKDLKEMLPYLPEEAHGIGWQAAGAAGYMYGGAAAGEETVNGGRAVFVLPGPLRSRPRLGARRLVQSNFSRIVHPLSDEVTSWLLESRRRAAALLRTQLVLVEEWSEQHLHLVLPALCKAIGDPEVRAVVRDCCSVIGAFTDPELSLQLLQPRVTDEGGDLAQRAAALEVLACVVRGAGPRRALDPHMPAVLDLMCLESLLGSEDTRIRRALHDLLEQLLATCGPACGRHAARLLWVCLHLRSPGRAVQAQPPVAAAAAAGSSEAAAAGEALGAAVEGVLMPRLAEVCGCSGGADELVEAHRVELLQQVHPEASGNVFLAAGVLARLMLPYASLSYVLYLPEDLLARVLPPPDAPTTTTAPLVVPTVPTAGEGPAPMEVEEAGAAAGGGGGAVAAASPSGRLYWQPASTAAVLTHLFADSSGWLARQPRCATLCVVCLEACLNALPGAGSGEGPSAGAAVAEGGQAAGGDAEGAGQPGEQLVATLIQLLLACQELPAQTLLAALRCVHTALRRGLLPDAVLAARLPELLQALAPCMAVVSGAPCRLQACHVMQMLLQAPAAAARVGAGAAGGGGGAGAAMQGVYAATAARLYDAADEVRCAALGLVREMVELTLRAGGGDASHGAALALVSEAAQLRDVAPGSAFYDAYGVFRDWAAARLPSAGLFQAAGQIPWELTPVLGLMTDLVPLWGYRRKAYLTLVGLIGAACWGGLALLPGSAVLAGCLLFGSSACTAWTQVVADSVLVGLSQGTEQPYAVPPAAPAFPVGALAKGRVDVASAYQTLSWLSYTAGALLSACTTGALLEAGGPRPVFLLAAAGLLVDAACAGLITEAPRRRRRPGEGMQGPREGGAGKGGADKSGRGAVAQGVAAGEGGAPEREPLLAAGEESVDGGRTDPLAAEPLLLPAGEARSPSLKGDATALLCLMWTTVREPRILLPALFVVCWRSCPSPTSAMFYFQAATLHFSPEFQEMTYLAGTLAGMAAWLLAAGPQRAPLREIDWPDGRAGVILYQLLLVRCHLRSLLLGCALLGAGLSATQLVLVSRLNVRWGISDKVFVLGDYAMLSGIAEVMMAPLLALTARVCPPGMEASLYACVYSALNMSGALAGALGALLTRACGVGGDGSGNLLLLVGLCCTTLLLPLPLLACMPGTQQHAVAGGCTEAGSRAAGTEAREGGVVVVDVVASSSVEGPT